MDQDQNEAFDPLKNLWNIHFDGPNEIILKVERTTPLKDMLKEYANKIEVPEETFGKEIILLFGCEQLDYKSSEIIESLGFRNNSSITVLDHFPWTIHFNASSGLKTIMKVNKEKTIEDMAKEYVNKFDVPEKKIGNGISFLYLDRNLDPKSKERVRELLKNNSTIDVLDPFNMIPWIIHFNTSTGLETLMKV